VYIPYDDNIKAYLDFKSITYHQGVVFGRNVIMVEGEMDNLEELISMAKEIETKKD